MNCFYHPRNEAAYTCSECGHQICIMCAYTVGNNPVCLRCAYGRNAKITTPLPSIELKSEKHGNITAIGVSKLLTEKTKKTVTKLKNISLRNHIF